MDRCSLKKEQAIFGIDLRSILCNAPEIGCRGSLIIGVPVNSPSLTIEASFGSHNLQATGSHVVASRMNTKERLFRGH